MTDAARKPAELNPDHVVCAAFGDTGMWVIGFVFSDKEAGVRAIRGVAQVYNVTAARAYGESGDKENAK